MDKLPRYAKDISTQRFGRWLVIAYSHSQMTGRRGAYWRCRCDCGIERVIHGAALRNGTSRSCGCGMRIKNTTHGLFGTPTYRTWNSMLTRCENSNHNSFAAYGAKGVTVCGRWHTFANFLADMGERPAGTTLDRYPDKDGNYEPGNCRWATAREQQSNKRGTVRYSFGGALLTLPEIAERADIKYWKLRQRVRKFGWSVERAATTP